MATSMVANQSVFCGKRVSPSIPFIKNQNFNSKVDGFRSSFNGLKISGVDSNFLHLKKNQNLKLHSKGMVKCAVSVKENYGIKGVQGTGRASMEDTSTCFVNNDKNKPSFFAVFDGHGGKAVSEFLKAEFWKVYQKNLASGDYIKATNLTYDELDKLTLASPKGFFGALRERGLGGSKCGSTAAVLLLIPNEKKFVTSNVGDAKIVLSREKKAYQLSVDHKPDILEERLRIEAKNPFPKIPLVRNIDGIWRVGGLLALSRAFGDAYLKNWSDGMKEGASGGYGLTAEPSIFYEDLTPEDEWIILGTDGLFDFVPGQDIVDLCCSGEESSPQILAENLVKLAVKRGSTDDISVIVIKLPKFV